MSASWASGDSAEVASPGQLDLSPRPPAEMTEAAGGLASSCSRHPSPAWPLCSAGPLGLWSQRTMVALWPLPRPLTVPVTHQGCWRPGPGTQRACPLIKRQTRSDGALQEAADEFIAGHSNDPTAVDLGWRWVNGRSCRVVSYRGHILFPGRARVSQTGRGGSIASLFEDGSWTGPRVWTDWRLPLYG